ncbi:hypothetical protein [Mesorhizobium sp.]|uniref:hypothetical protein n=1 Tax=Mesorhizobium sp. TaxID=1871066 RepID=UPI00257BB391|nr:hypothetical protein [Mesorhizobium sp.]
MPESLIIPAIPAVPYPFSFDGQHWMPLTSHCQPLLKENHQRTLTFRFKAYGRGGNRTNLDSKYRANLVSDLVAQRAVQVNLVGGLSAGL